ncbi:MAG TPA: ABC transporter permease [Spirochaetia bacterium]|nr:ABC transporter permease [Spirochaetales bacterium]HRY72481.1 ABC transporter permease [Spirochaetia bacterium]
MNRRVKAIARKEFRHILRDPGSLGALLGLPLFLLLMFGYAVSLDVKRVPLAVRDLDRSPESRALAAAILSAGDFVPGGTPDSPAAEAEALDSGRAAAVLEIPRGFSALLAERKSASVQLLVDGSDGTRAQTVLGYLESAIRRFGEDRLVLEAARLPSGASRALAVDARPRVLFNQELRSVLFLVPGLVALILIITAVVSASLSVVREKETGSMEQILVSPVGSFEFIVGKTLPYAAVGAVSAATVLAVAALVFGVAVKGSLLALAASTALFLLACLGLGVLISTLAETQQVAFLVSTMATLIPTFTLSGFVFPLRNMPLAIRAAARLFPTTYYIEILNAILVKGAGIAAYWRPAAALAAYAAATALASAARFARARR